MINTIYKINEGLDHRFPNGRNPYKILARLLEECGELAMEVHRFENEGVKQKKHGEPNKTDLAKEIQDVLRSALQICSYYKAEEELEKSVRHSYQKLKEEGHIK